MSVEETFLNTVRVIFCIYFIVVNTMVTGPLQHTVLESGCSKKKKEKFDQWVSIVSFVRKESVIAGGDGHPGNKVKDDA